MAQPDHVKVFVDLSDEIVDGWPPTTGEWLWAVATDEDGMYRIDSIPIFVRGLSCGDVVAVKVADHALFVLGRVLRGGHSTVRIVPLRGTRLEEPPIAEFWSALSKIGCGYEGFSGRPLFGIDIPPGALPEARPILDDAEKAGIWEYETGDIQ